MTTKIKLSLLVGVSFALAATPALAQTVPSATPDGGLFADFGFVADVTPPTIANENVVPGVSYDSVSTQTGTANYVDGLNVDTVNGVNVLGVAQGTFNRDERTVTNVDLVVPANTVTNAPTYTNTGNTTTNLNVFGSASTGTAITSTVISTVDSTAVGAGDDTVDVTQIVSSIDASGITFASYSGTATYNVDLANPLNGDISVSFNPVMTSGTTLDQNGLNTTGTVTAATVNATTVNATDVNATNVNAANGNFTTAVTTPHLTSTTGSLLIDAGGPSYIQVNQNDVTIHGGSASTTGVWDNAGYHQYDTTNGLTFDVDNNGNVWSLGNSTVGGNLQVNGNANVSGFTTTNGIDNAGNIETDSLTVNNNASVGGNLTVAGSAQASQFFSQSGAYYNSNSAGGQSISWNDGTNYYYNDQTSGYNQLYWTNGTSSSANTSDAGGTYISNSSGNYAYLTTGGLSTNGSVSTNNLYANYASVGTADIGTANVTTANVGTLAVSGTASVGGLLSANGGLAVTGGTTTDSLTVTGATVTNGITNTGNISTTTLTTSGNATIGGALAVTGNYTTTNGSITTTNGNITATNGTVTGAALVSTGSTSVGTNLTVGGTSDFRGAIFNGGTANGGAVYVNDALTVTGEVAVGTVRINPTTNKISGLANATLSSTSTEAVTGQQLFATNTALATLDAREASHFNLLMHRADKAYQGVAMGFASNAAPLNLDNGEGGISAGVGVFQGQWAGAIRAQYVTDSGVGVGVNFGFSEDAVGGGVGASIKF